MKRLSCLLLVLLCCLPAGAEDWTYDSGITLVDSLKAVGEAVVLSGMRGELLGENVARLEVWGAGEDALAVFEGVARPGGAAQDALYLGGDSFAVLSGAAGDHEALALECVFAGETAWRSAAIPWASRIYAAGGCLLVNSFPMLDGARLLAFGREGTLLWTRDFDETVHFTDIFAAGDGFVACGWAQVGDKAYPRAIGLDAGGAEVWRYAATGPGETVAAGMDGADVLLLIDVDGGDGATRLLRLRAGEAVAQTDYPAAQYGGAATQGALSLLPCAGGALIAVNLGRGDCLLRRVDADGEVLGEWREPFAGTLSPLHGVREAALFMRGGNAYIAVCGKPPDAEALAATDWFDTGATTPVDLPSVLVIRRLDVPGGNGGASMLQYNR